MVSSWCPQVERVNFLMAMALKLAIADNSFCPTNVDQCAMYRVGRHDHQPWSDDKCHLHKSQMSHT